jgi:hypothetical protein
MPSSNEDMTSLLLCPSLRLALNKRSIFRDPGLDVQPPLAAWKRPGRAHLEVYMYIHYMEMNLISIYGLVRGGFNRPSFVIQLV